MLHEGVQWRLEPLQKAQKRVHGPLESSGGPHTEQRPQQEVEIEPGRVNTPALIFDSALSSAARRTGSQRRRASRGRPGSLKDDHTHVLTETRQILEALAPVR